jgi:superfamily II DNA or RNA helicase
MNQELKEIWDSIKDDINLTKKVNESKLERQLEIFKTCISQGLKSYVEACTRFGKTMIAIIGIKRLNLKQPDFTTIVIVPTTNLYNDWMNENGHINTFNLKNVEVYIINSYILNDKMWKCDFLILDEIHRYANKDSEFFSKVLLRTSYRYVLGLSATLDFHKREFLKAHGLRRGGLVRLEEAERKGWVAKHKLYNFGITLEDEELKEQLKTLNDIHESNFARFDHNYHKARACVVGNNKYYKVEGVNLTGFEWRQKVAEQNGWNKSLGNDHEWSPKSISKYAQLWNSAISKRKFFLANVKDKIDITVKILEYLNRPSLIFSESTEFADNVAILLEEAASYHSKIPTRVYADKTFNKLIAVSIGNGKFKMIRSGEILEFKEVKMKFKNATKLASNKLKTKIKDDFNSGNINYLLTVKALDEGFDSDRASVGIIASGQSSSLQDTQRTGRSLNFVEGKESIIINLYIKGSQDEKWLKSRQINVKDSKIEWIDSIEQIEK